jgi:hypothetical protein
LLHQSLSKQWGYTLEELNLSSKVPYFWDDTVGYVAAEPRSNVDDNQAVKSDIVYINYLKNNIKDKDNVYYRLQEYKVDILMVKDDFPMSVNTSFSFGTMFTNFFQSMPKDEDGCEVNNPLFVPGNIKCRNENGIHFLKKYDNIREGLRDASKFFNLTGSDVEDFTILHKFHNFSLTAYRMYFVLSMVFLKGGEMYDRNHRINRRGYRLPTRGNALYIKKETIFGDDISSYKRPAGRTWKEDSF